MCQVLIFICVIKWWAVAMGHPIGATGAILLTKLDHELERIGKNTD
jgi:hypothetical protein